MGAVLLCAAWTEFRWRQFESPAAVGAEIASVGKSEAEVCREWFTDYADALGGMNVPYDCRIGKHVWTKWKCWMKNGYVQMELLHDCTCLCQQQDDPKNLELVF